MVIFWQRDNVPIQVCPRCPHLKWAESAWPEPPGEAGIVRAGFRNAMAPLHLTARSDPYYWKVACTELAPLRLLEDFCSGPRAGLDASTGAFLRPPCQPDFTWSEVSGCARLRGRGSWGSDSYSGISYVTLGRHLTSSNLGILKRGHPWYLPWVTLRIKWAPTHSACLAPAGTRWGLYSCSLSFYYQQ